MGMGVWRHNGQALVEKSKPVPVACGGPASFSNLTFHSVEQMRSESLRLRSSFIQWKYRDTGDDFSLPTEVQLPALVVFCTNNVPEAHHCASALAPDPCSFLTSTSRCLPLNHRNSPEYLAVACCSASSISTQPPACCTTATARLELPSEQQPRSDSKRFQHVVIANDTPLRRHSRLRLSVLCFVLLYNPDIPFRNLALNTQEQKYSKQKQSSCVTFSIVIISSVSTPSTLFVQVTGAAEQLHRQSPSLQPSSFVKVACPDVCTTFQQPLLSFHTTNTQALTCGTQLNALILGTTPHRSAASCGHKLLFPRRVSEGAIGES